MLHPSLIARTVSVLLLALASSPSPARGDAGATLRSILGDTPGAVAVHDRTTNQWHLSDTGATRQRHAPFSTFKLWNTVFALDSGAAPGIDHEIAWNPELYPQNSLRNKGLAAPHTLEAAFRKSVVWYYREIAKRIGRERMQAYLDRVDYGNRDISAGVDRFWLSSSLEISPREQVDRLGALLVGDLGFSAETIESLRQVAYEETVSGCRIYGKTGAGPADASEKPWRWHGWYVGWRECGPGDLVTFAVFLEADSYADLRDRRYAVARQALELLGLLPRSPLTER